MTNNKPINKNSKKRSSLNKDLLIKLIKGLEDIRAGRVKSWDKIKNK
ncbi:MAG: hypothetical protein ABIH37_03060 [archaeon]